MSSKVELDKQAATDRPTPIVNSNAPLLSVGLPPASCPELLTEEEAVRYLRLDTIRGLRNPCHTLARYRAQGLLRGTQVSKSVFYRRVELDRFLDRLTNENPR